MEDLGYWLVAKLEGKHVKKILPTYPCIKPSDTIAFRTSFANFLDTLRHSSMKDNTMAAGFWRHVQARKSYLEECSGKRYPETSTTENVCHITTFNSLGFSNSFCRSRHMFFSSCKQASSRLRCP
ncbi:hypothetical protein EV361DRAFT_792090 [Lentinula raphanica]|nr:hypothetical protein EV361DRAFT_792090 [Lentinula raphanica]